MPTGSSGININGCITSDSAIYIAEINGGKQFRDFNSDYQILANLGRDSAQPWEEWDVTNKSSIIQNKELVFVINARTGEIFSKITLGISRRDPPNNYALMHNYPNPFNSETRICLSLQEEQEVSAVLYNDLGQRVRTLWQGKKQPGRHEIRRDGRNEATETVSSGIYFCRISPGNSNHLLKLVMIK